MKRLPYLLSAAALLATLSACEQEFERSDAPIVLFTAPADPIVTQVGRSVEGEHFVLDYRYGGNRRVSISVPEQSGIGAEPIDLTLDADTGSCSLPLLGQCDEAGVVTLRARIVYDVFTIFCPATVVVRPVPMPPVTLLAEPELTGQLYEHLPASNACLTLSYKEGWARNASVRFECGDPGIAPDPISVRLADDASAATLEVPLPGTPQSHGGLTLTACIRFEGDEQEQRFRFEHDVLQAVPYEEQTVSHEIVVTPRPELLAGGEIRTQTFEYRTVFVDMNGDGYVSSNAEIWLDRNVGATSTDPADEASYGFIYQPGRDAPGWVSNSQSGNNNTNYPGERYKRNNMTWFNGTVNDVSVQLLDATGKPTTQTVTIPAGKVGPNNPCPYGFRPPHASEWQALYEYLGCKLTDYAALRSGLLRIPFVTSIVDNTDAAKTEARGSYWCAPFDDNQVPAVYFFSNPAVANRPKGYAMPVRCVKAREEELTAYER